MVSERSPEFIGRVHLALAILAFLVLLFVVWIVRSWIAVKMNYEYIRRQKTFYKDDSPK